MRPKGIEDLADESRAEEKAEAALDNSEMEEEREIVGRQTHLEDIEDSNSDQRAFLKLKELERTLGEKGTEKGIEIEMGR